MNIIVVNKSRRRSSADITSWRRMALSACLMSIPVGMVALDYHTSQSKEVLRTDRIHRAWVEPVRYHETLVTQAQNDVESTGAIRFDDDTLISGYEYEQRELNFSTLSVLNGLNLSVSYQIETPSFILALSNMAEQSQKHHITLENESSLLRTRRFALDLFVSGEPVKSNSTPPFYSTRIGTRINRSNIQHDIGLVTKGDRNITPSKSGVTTLLESQTKYADHFISVNVNNETLIPCWYDKKIIAQIGDVVRKRQVIATAASIGHSTEAHVYFDMHKHGRIVDPSIYIKRVNS